MLSELDNYLQRIKDLRGQVRDLIAGLPAEALNWRPIPPSNPPRERGGGEDQPTNSLAVMAAHIAGAEHFWIAEVIGGRASTRDRDAEFAVTVVDAVELVRRLEIVGVETRKVFAVLRPNDLDGAREARGKTVAVRWGILHVIDHASLHLGHMQITYQLWKRGVSKSSPRWFERLPKGE